MSVLYLLSLFLLACNSYIEHPNNFVESLVFEGNIVDLKKENINSKEELLESFNNNTTNKYGKLSLVIIGDGYYHSEKYVIVYVNPLCNNKVVLNTNDYKAGMPIVLGGMSGGSNYDSWGERGYFKSEQSVILIKGHSEWADSSYEYNGEKFTILPVSDDNESAELRFTYTVFEK